MGCFRLNFVSHANRRCIKIVKEITVGGNTAKDGSGTPLILVVDSDGYLKVVQQGSIAITNADLTSIKNAVEIMDDWDEADHCKMVLYGKDGANYYLAKVNSSGELSVYTP